MPDLPSDSHQSPPIRQENPNKSSPALGKKETTTVTSKWETSTRTTDLKREQGRFPVRGAAVPRAALGWSENRDGRGGAAEQHWGRSSGLELLHKKEYLYTQRKRKGGGRAVTEGDGKPTHPVSCTSGARYHRVAPLPPPGCFPRGKARPRGRNSVRELFPRTGGEGFYCTASETTRTPRRGWKTPTWPLFIGIYCLGPTLSDVQGVAVGPPPLTPVVQCRVDFKSYIVDSISFVYAPSLPQGMLWCFCGWGLKRVI
ncbi:hypothetical protein BHE74_00020019 [Ensete ventricosum]|nr:hypothetical protein BHE74_00020019 [Ensete ventricosum]